EIGLGLDGSRDVRRQPVFVDIGQQDIDLADPLVGGVLGREKVGLTLLRKRTLQYADIGTAVAFVTYIMPVGRDGAYAGSAVIYRHTQLVEIVEIHVCRRRIIPGRRDGHSVE